MREYKEGDWIFVNRSDDQIEYLVSYDLAIHFDQHVDLEVFGENGGIPEGNALDWWEFRSLGWNPQWDWDTADVTKLVKDHPVHLFLIHEDVEVLRARGDLFALEDVD